MKMWRVMGNQLGYGTFVVEDCLLSEELAEARAFREMGNRQPGWGGHLPTYFIQQYEESRLNHGCKNDQEPA